MPRPTPEDEFRRRYAVLEEARAALVPHLRAQADAELALARGARLSAPGDPTRAELERAALKAEADYRWCLAVEVAAAEAVKGMTLEEAMAQNDTGRVRMQAGRDQALQALEGT